MRSDGGGWQGRTFFGNLVCRWQPLSNLDRPPLLDIFAIQWQICGFKFREEFRAELAFLGLTATAMKRHLRQFSVQATFNQPNWSSSQLTKWYEMTARWWVFSSSPCTLCWWSCWWLNNVLHNNKRCTPAVLSSSRSIWKLAWPCWSASLFSELKMQAAAAVFIRESNQ